MSEEDERAAVLAAVLAEVTEHPDGVTSQQVEHAVPDRLLRQGRTAVTMSRDRAKGFLRQLEDRGQVRKERKQAAVLYYPAAREEAPHAE